MRYGGKVVQVYKDQVRIPGQQWINTYNGKECFSLLLIESSDIHLGDSLFWSDENSFCYLYRAMISESEVNGVVVTKTIDRMHECSLNPEHPLGDIYRIFRLCRIGIQ